jgi:acyl-CoA synthetase (NDP forming)
VNDPALDAVSGRADPYGRADLARLLVPRSVAVIGASERAGSFGARVLENLAMFDGSVYPVNARYERLGERPCYPRVGALPEVPDCVVITAGREAVEGIVEECAALGVGGAVVVASGYAETGKPERAAQQARLAAIARRAGMRLVGPNTIGLVNYACGAALTFSAMPPRRALQPYAIGIVSQSGSLGFSLSQAVMRGVSISHVLTAGNSCDVDVADYVAYLAEEPACRAIACLFEGLTQPRRMIAAADLAWRAGKPLVIYKLATGAEGARAAMSHTGSLAGSGAAYAAAFARSGAVQVDKLEALVETAAFFAKAPRPKAPGVAVVATSGGAAIMAADKAELHGVALPQPGPAGRAVLEARIPEYGSPRNPCDITAQVITDPGSLHACAEALLTDPQYGALVTSHAYAYEAATRRLPLFSQLAAAHGKIVCNVWVPEWLGGPGAQETEGDPHLALFHSMDRCFATLAAWHRREGLRQAPRRPASRVAPDSARAEAAEALRRAPGDVLTEREAKRVLAMYGVPVVAERLVQGAEEAVEAAETLGYPVVLKIESADIPHKTEAGVVRLNLRSAAEVRAACAEILGAAEAVVPRPRLGGVLVQPMVPTGVEVMVGARTDPLFGPLIVVGLGGVLVELLKDTALALAPVTPGEALAMLRGLKGAALLGGFRGTQPVEMDRLAEIVARLSELAADHEAQVAEMDVNPLICAGPRIVAVDGLIVKHGTRGRGT